MSVGVVCLKSPATESRRVATWSVDGDGANKPFALGHVMTQSNSTSNAPGTPSSLKPRDR